MTAHEKPQSGKAEPNNALRENVRTFIWAAVIAVLIRSLLFQPFNIPSSSMKPALLMVQVYQETIASQPINYRVLSSKSTKHPN